MKDYPDQIYWKHRTALTGWVNRLHLAFVKLRAKLIYMITHKLAFLFESLILLPYVEQQKLLPSVQEAKQISARYLFQKKPMAFIATYGRLMSFLFDEDM